MKMKLKANKRWRNKDYRYLTELKTYAGLSKEEFDVVLRGVPFEGKRYPLHYIFWGDTRKYRKVSIFLTGEVGTVIGDSIIELPRKEQNIHRAIVRVGDRVTDLAFSVLRNM